MEKLILQLGEMTWSRVILGGLIAAGVYWGLAYDNGDSLETLIKTLNDKQIESERQLSETKKAMADAEKFEKDVHQNELQFEKVLEYLPQELGANELTRLVNQQAQISGVRVQTTRAIDLVEKKDFYEMARLDFAIGGTFQQVVAFMASLSKIQRLLTFDKVEIKADAGNAKSDSAPTVSLAATLVGYRYLKDAGPPVPGAPGSATSAGGARAK